MGRAARAGIVATAWLALSVLPQAAHAAALTLAVSQGPVSLLVYVAESKQYFREEGLDVRTLRCPSGRECLELMAQGHAQVATAAEFAAVSASMAGGTDLAVFATISGSANQVKLISRRAVPLGAKADILGRRFGTVQGTSAQYFLSLWLDRSRLGKDDVRTEFFPPEQLPAELRSDRVDAIAVWEPHASRALRELGPNAIEHATAGVYHQHFVLATARATLTERRAELGKLLVALIRAERFVADNPESAWRLLSTRLGMQPADAQQYLANQDFRVRLDASLERTIEGQVRWIRANGQPGPARRPGRPLIEAGVLFDVAPKAVSVRR